MDLGQGHGAGMSTTHLRKPDWSGLYCKSQSKRALRSTTNPASAECSRCRKAAGLGAYSGLDAIKSMVVKVSVVQAVPA